MRVFGTPYVVGESDEGSVGNVSDGGLEGVAEAVRGSGSYVTA